MGLPDDAAARNVARIYALIARDIRQGTRSAPSFRDAVALHENPGCDRALGGRAYSSGATSLRAM